MADHTECETTVRLILDNLEEASQIDVSVIGNRQFRETPRLSSECHAQLNQLIASGTPLAEGMTWYETNSLMLKLFDHASPLVQPPLDTIENFVSGSSGFASNIDEAMRKLTRPFGFGVDEEYEMKIRIGTVKLLWEHARILLEVPKHPPITPASRDSDDDFIEATTVRAQEAMCQARIEVSTMFAIFDNMPPDQIRNDYDDATLIIVQHVRAILALLESNVLYPTDVDRTESFWEKHGVKDKALGAVIGQAIRELKELVGVLIG